MDEKIKKNNRKSLIKSHRIPSALLSFPRKGSSEDNERQILFNHKTSLETLLNLIKNFQIECLSNEEIKNKNKTTKNMLNSLKDNLNLMFQEKNKKLNYMRAENEANKKKIQNILYPSSQESKNNENKIKKYNNNKNVHSSFLEKNQLVLLNFQIENEIEKIDFLIEQKSQINSYIRSIPFFFETNKEIFCNNKYEDLSIISKLLKEIIREVRKEFIEVVKDKMQKELEINGITIQINYIKDNIEDFKLNGCKKYIETEDIIQEESREYTKSIITNQSKRNSFASINNRSIIKKMSGINSKNTKNKSIKKKERIIKDNNLFYTHKVNKDIFNGINNNNVNNYLNMNINVNINLNNKNQDYQESFNSSLDSNDKEEGNEQNEQYEMDLNNNNKIIITPIITTENKNKLNSKNNSINSESNENDDSFVLDFDDK